MSTYRLTFEGRESALEEIDCETVEAARTVAIRRLGAYLADHPDFAERGHWRVNVENAVGQPLLHVIVATVTARNAPADPPGSTPARG